MLSNQAQGAVVVSLLAPASAANTAAATSGWIDVRNYEGDLVFIVNTGTITGTNTLTIRDADDGAGANPVAVTPNEGAPAVINSASQVRKFTVNSNSCRGWVQLVGTIVTGPNVIGAVMMALPKYT